MTDLPDSARAVVVGGGIVGCSTAYHLAKRGLDTVLLERNRLTSGTTFHAAGLVGQLRSSANVTRLLGYSIDLYDRLEAETGQATGWKMNGGLRLACNAERWTEVRRQATTARSFGLDMRLLSAAEAQELWPLMRVDDVVGAAFLPTDGQANPSDIARALAAGARKAGALVLEGAEAERVEIRNGTVAAVETSQGRIACGAVVACCGQWTREFAARAGVNVPLASLQHQYLVTEAIEGVRPDLPTLRDPDRLTYYKEEVGGLAMGGYEPNPLEWEPSRLPAHAEFSLLDSDFDHFEPLLKMAMGRVPALEGAGVKQLIAGAESFTPDGNFVLGEAPECRGFFVGAGFNAFGIASGGGAGMALAEWVADGAPPYDLWSVDIRRFGQPHQDTDWIRKRTYEAYGRHYTMAWPSEEYESARPVRRSPLYSTLAAAGAVFGEKLGWERPNWYAVPGEAARDVYTFGRPNWHEAVGREHAAARERAALFDQTSFAKFVLKGPDAAAALGWIAANDVDRPVGRIVYTQMLNDRGGIECDLTCVRTDWDSYYVVTGTGFATHDFMHIARNVPTGMRAELFDVTGAWAVLSLFGPEARNILQRATIDDVSSDAFPFATARTIGIAGSPVRALRITYVGELGWELHVPVEGAVAVHAAIAAAGKEFGLQNAGYRAIETLRLEKGYRAWPSDIGPDYTPEEAGLGWAVKLGKDVDFRGRKAAERQRSHGVRRMLATFSAAPEVVLHGGETIFRNGDRVGYLSSAGFGHTVGRSIGLGYVRNAGGVDRDYVLGAAYELEAAGDRVPCEVHLTPLYDPDMVRAKS